MGWHTRHASTSSGLEGHLRPETLNLTAWNHALGLLLYFTFSTFYFIYSLPLHFYYLLCCFSLLLIYLYINIYYEEVSRRSKGVICIYVYVYVYVCADICDVLVDIYVRGLWYGICRTVEMRIYIRTCGCDIYIM